MTATIGSRPIVDVRSFTPSQGQAIEVKRGDHYGAKGFIDEHQLEPSLQQIVSQFGAVGFFLSGGLKTLEERAAQTIFDKIKASGDIPEFVQVTVAPAPASLEETIKRTGVARLNYEFIALKKTPGTKLIDKLLAVILGIVISSIALTALLNQATEFFWGPATSLKVKDPKTGEIVFEFKGPASQAPKEFTLTPQGGVSFQTPGGPGGAFFTQDVVEFGRLLVIIIAVVAGVVLVITFARRR